MTDEQIKAVLARNYRVLENVRLRRGRDLARMIGHSRHDELMMSYETDLGLWRIMGCVGQATAFVAAEDVISLHFREEDI